MDTSFAVKLSDNTDIHDMLFADPPLRETRRSKILKHSENE
jgi:hypothetical protein